MSQTSSISLKAVRIIPFDIGIDIDNAIVREIKKTFENVSTREEFLLEGRVVNIKVMAGKTPLEIDLFQDGVGIVSFLEDSLIDSIEEFDPLQILQKRAQVHKAILNHEHVCSETMDKIIEKLREIARRSTESRSKDRISQIRFTASKNWEKKGLSYVMSIYLVDMPELALKLKDPKENSIRRKFASFMEPSVYRTEDTFAKGVLPMFRPRTTSVESALLDEVVNRIFAVDYDMDPSITTYMTWSNVVVVGNINDHVVHEYTTLQKKLQHVWFYSYIADKLVKKTLEQFEESEPRIDVEYLDRLRSGISLKIDEFVNIQESTIGSRYFRLIKGFMETSQLDKLVSSLEKKVELLGSRIEREDAKNRQRGQRRIEFVLFILTYLSGVSSVLTVIQQTNVYFAILFHLPLILLLLYLYDP
jgi:transcription-repair coupling factor (superfamily II helicase)